MCSDIETVKAFAVTISIPEKHYETILEKAERNGLALHEYVYHLVCKDAVKQKRVKNSDYSDDFERFWNSYPRKVGKGVAWKAFEKAILKVTLGRLMTSVRIQQQSKQWKDKTYIPHPATWLRREGWLDELERDGSEFVVKPAFVNRKVE